MIGFALLTVISSIILFYIIGNTILSIFSNETYRNEYASVLSKCITGLLLSVFLCASIITRGNTVLWGCIVVALLYLTFYYKEQYTINNIKCFFNKKEIIPLVIILSLGIISFSYQAYHFYNEPYNNIPHEDYGFYGILGELMTEHHTESTIFTNDIFSESKAATPYHYFDSWMGVLLSEFFRINNVESLYMCAYPVLFALYSFSIITIAKLFTSNIFFQICSLATLCFMPVTWFDFTRPLKDIIIEPAFWGYHALVTPKTLIIALLSAYTIIAFFNNRIKSIFILLLLPFISTVTAPAIYTATTIYAINQLILHRKNEFIKLLVAIFSTALFLLFFYILQPTGLQTNEFSTNHMILNLGQNLLVIVKSCVKFVLYMVIFHIPMVICLFLCRKNEKIKDFVHCILLCFLICLCGFIFSQIMSGIDNATQFLTVPALITPILYGIVLVMLLQTFTKTIDTITILTGATFMVLYFKTSIQNVPIINEIRIAHKLPYSEEYLNNIEKIVHEEKGIGCNFSTSFCPHFCYQTNRINLKMVGIPEQFLHKESSSFYQFAQNKKENFENLQLEFIKTHKIQYFIAEKDEILPYTLIPYIETIFCDKNTGEKFYVLKF